MELNSPVANVPGGQMKLRDVALDDKYTLERGQIFVSGTQALVRLPMLQSQRDQAVGLNTAGFVTGYRGSPLGGLDQQLFRAQEHLTRHRVQFAPAVNEDLGATAVWGTQQANLSGNGLYDGVFAMWYAKGPGVDRSGDAIRHGNLAGTSPNGGVLLLLGDDHTCESSTTAHQSEYSLVNAMVPVLNPAGVQDILDYGLYGWSLSRYSGCWVGLKCVHDTVEASASVSVSVDRIETVVPEDFILPNGGVHIRWPDAFLEQEERLHRYKLEAVEAFACSNPIDRQIMGDSDGQTGIVTTGKSYLDVRRALLELNIDERRAKTLGLKLYKVGMSWPLEPSGVRSFTKGLKRLIVIEEKRGLIEQQLRQILYGVPNAPTIVGKCAENGESLFPAHGRLEAMNIALSIGERLARITADEDLSAQIETLKSRQVRDSTRSPGMIRAPYFCAGCPHNSSTVVPDGSRAMAGIGCHFMAAWMDRSTAGFTQMGAEGSSWIGESPFSGTSHVFQNIGDGTYFHSGILAIRASVTAGVNITYKILHNDAVAMTGGQRVDGLLDPAVITRQVHAEGVRRIAVVSDDLNKYSKSMQWAPNTTFHHRDQLDVVQREIRAITGTTVIVYDQTCAAEKRRRRRRGEMAIPAKRLFINETVCEGCGDCGTQSNCVALVPVETQLGRKRAINQSTCNMDYSCQSGFCPSFVTVIGGSLKKGHNRARFQALSESLLLEPEVTPINGHYSILLTGIGGTGVVTVGAILGMAAHLAGKGCSVLDMAGLAQKGGAVTSYIVLAEKPEDINATHVADSGADLLLGCDIVTSASDESLKKLRSGTVAVVNTHQQMSGDFIKDPDTQFPLESLLSSIRDCVGSSLHTLDSTAVASAAFGESIAGNLMILGFGYQLGGIPVPSVAIEKAIELNGQAVQMNVQAFRMGRAAAAKPDEVGRLLGSVPGRQSAAIDETVEQTVERLESHLVAYQSKRYARRFRTLVETVQNIESAIEGNTLRFTLAIAQSYHKLLAVKDEYEVARLYTDKYFKESLESTFEGSYRLKVNLAPPIMSKIGRKNGTIQKRAFGGWIFTLFRLMKVVRRIRGTVLDPFRYSKDRMFDQQLVRDYERTVGNLCAGLSAHNLDAAIEIALLPLSIRGFGHIKIANATKVESTAEKLWSEFEAPVLDVENAA